MAWLGAKVSWCEVSFILKNTFSVGIFWWNRPHTSFLRLISYMVGSGAKLFRTKTLLNFASKALSNSFLQKTRFRFEFLYKIAPHLFSWPNGLDGTIVGKSVTVWSFVHPKKHDFGWNFWWNRSHTSFLRLVGYMVGSGAKLFRTKTLLNFASKALSNSFFQKTRFRFEFLY
jgi:hypothetical protein